MTLVALEKVGRSYGDHVVLEDVSVRIDVGDRVGVVGDNGAGKTTLVRILAGSEDADQGRRVTRRDLRVAYAAQIPQLQPGDTVLAMALRGDGSQPRLEQRVAELEGELAAHPGDERLLDEYGHAQALFEAGGGYQRRALCERVLSGLGFAPSDLDKDVGVLSGGEKSRLALAALMTAPADLLILDEPTNHLDLEGIEFLAEHLSRGKAGVVVVSHDRDFLDRVATTVFEVDSAGVQRYRGNYSAYVRQRDERLLAQARAWRNQREMIDKEMDYIRRNMAGRMSAQAKGRLKRLQRIERLQQPRGERPRLQLRLAGGRGQAGQAVIETSALGATLPNGRVLFRGAELRINYGETVGVLGRNGAGKTTLLRLLAGLDAPRAGSVRHAPGVHAGYFRQDMLDLPDSGTVLEALRALDATVGEKELRDHLALFWFRGDEVDKPVASLSGGEKRRLCLARLLRSQFDFLCLDEPTNHLDIAARESLEQTLTDYPGAALVVSHDRAFLAAVVDRVFHVEDGKVVVYDGGLEQWQARPRPTAPQRPAAAPARAEPPGDKPRGDGRVRNPLMFEKLEAEIMAIEARLEELAGAMATPEVYLDPSRVREVQSEQAQLRADLAAAYQRWETWQ